MGHRYWYVVLWTAVVVEIYNCPPPFASGFHHTMNLSWVLWLLLTDSDVPPWWISLRSRPPLASSFTHCSRAHGRLNHLFTRSGRASVLLLPKVPNCIVICKESAEREKNWPGYPMILFPFEAQLLCRIFILRHYGWKGIFLFSTPMAESVPDPLRLSLYLYKYAYVGHNGG